jgi:hypothetical protein
VNPDLSVVPIVGGLAAAVALSRRPAKQSTDLYAPTAADRRLLASGKKIWVTFYDRDAAGNKFRAVEGPFPSRSWADDYAHGALAPDRRGKVVVGARPALRKARTRLGGAP